MKNGIILSAIVFTLSLTACSNYLEEFEDEYRDSAYAKTDIFSPTESSASIIEAGDSSGTSSKDASSSDARAEGQSSGKTDEEYDCYMNDSACISEIANEFDKTVRLLDSRNNNVYTAIYVGGLDYETANGYGSIFDDSVSFLLMTENLEYEGESVTALDTNGVFFYTYENAEKACPTGWRLPKITPEWFFLLTGDGHQFNIELPDDEKGCYTDGKFDSGKSIFYWAQKEGETSWFVKKSYLANDSDLHEQERCNTFPVRCVKEFGRHADYAGSSSSSGETKSSSSAKSSSSSVVSSSSEVCSEYYRLTNAPVARITFVNKKNNSETMDGIIEGGEYFNPENSIILAVKQRVVDSFSACNLKYGDIQVKSSGNGEFKDNDTFKSICYNSDIVKVIVSDEDFSCIKNYSNCFSENKLSFNSECPVAVAAKFLGSSSSSVTGSMLFDANENYKMTNDSAINVESFDKFFADGWMKVSRYLSNSPYISFNTDPGLENAVGALPVDISAWGGICMTYASNVDINVVAKKTDEYNPEISVGPFRKTNGNQAEFACVGWKKEGDMTNIDQIRLEPVSSSSSDPAVIYIKNIYTKKPTDVTISKGDLNCDNTSTGFSCSVGDDKQIDLSLFDSYTLDNGSSSGYLDLKVSSGSNEYLVFGQENNQMENLNVCSTENPPVTEDYCQELKKFTYLQNPKLKEIQGTGSFENFYSITFHPKSWYAQ